MAGGRFDLRKHEPFIIGGEKGDHEIPHPEKFDLETIEIVSGIQQDMTLKEKLDAVKAFFYRVCPELKEEAISDYAWLQIMAAYEEYSTGE